MYKHTLSTLLATTALAASLTAAPAASADSIAYTKGGSVWLSTGDGSRQYQVTDGGGYTEVSQSDDGHLVALHGDQIAYLDRTGQVLADIKTPVSTSTDPTRQFFGPFDPVISPDGKKVAYSYYYQYIGYDPYCNPTLNCYVKRIYQGTAYTYPSRLTSWDEPGMRRQSGWIHPVWLDNDTNMLFDPAVSPNEDAVVTSPVKDEASGFTRWFSHPGAKGWHDSDVSRDNTKLAGVTGDADDHILFARMTGLPEHGGAPNYPTQCPYEIKDPEGGKFHTVSWSPDGSRLSYADGAGIHTVPIPAYTTDCGNPTENPTLLVAGAKSPFWGPADVPAARTFPPAGGGGNPGGGSGGSGGVTPPPASGGGSSGGGIVLGGGPATPGGPAPAPLKLGRVLTKGLPLTVQVSTPGTLTVTAKSGGTTLATAKVKAKQAGARSIKLTFTKAARRGLAKAKKVTLTITSSLKPKAGGKAIRQTTKISIKR